jgi:uncharacterized protein (DUF58 family)
MPAPPRTTPDPSRIPHLRRVVPLTARGVGLLCVAAVVLAAGITRADMAGMFWGSSFLLAALWAAAGSHVMRALSARALVKPGALEILLPPSALSPGDEGEALVTAEMPRVFPPGFTVSLELPLSWNGRNLTGVRAPLAPGMNRVSVRFRAPARGSYTAAAALVCARDILGLASCPLVVETESSVKVLPRMVEMQRPLPVHQEGGEALRRETRRRRSEELLEVRKYFPGDDVRRLNWKVFAHAGELFLRVGEETPPPESRFLLILDATENPLVPPAVSADYLDSLVEAAAAAMKALLGRGAEIQLWMPGAAAARSFGPDTAPEVLLLLCGTAWSPPGWQPALPGTQGMHAVVISSPGSPSLEGLMRDISSRGWRASLILPDLRATGGPRRRITLRSLLLVPRDPRPPREPVVPEPALADFRQAMARERGRYGQLVTGGRDEAR